jgi:hypothetical protein
MEAELPRDEAIVNWIDVLDRLPKTYSTVLVFVSRCGIHSFQIASLCGDDPGTFWSIGENVDDNFVTHWAPLVGPDGETVE